MKVSHYVCISKFTPFMRQQVPFCVGCLVLYGCLYSRGAYFLCVRIILRLTQPYQRTCSAVAINICPHTVSMSFFVHRIQKKIKKAKPVNDYMWMTTRICIMSTWCWYKSQTQHKRLKTTSPSWIAIHIKGSGSKHVHHDDLQTEGYPLSYWRALRKQWLAWWLLVICMLDLGCCQHLGYCMQSLVCVPKALGKICLWAVCTMASPFFEHPGEEPWEC